MINGVEKIYKLPYETLVYGLNVVNSIQLENWSKKD